MQLPPLTTKQQEILHLLYTHRFLNRNQIQTFLQHKDKRRIIYWLKDMREKQYVTWIYDETNFIEKSKPAVYYLNLNGVRFLKSLNQYPLPELRIRYRERSRQPSFITHCMLLADCCIAIEARNRECVDIDYYYVREPTRARYGFAGGFLDELGPSLYFVKQEANEATPYLLDIIPPTLPRYRLRKRLKDYVVYVSSELWRHETGMCDSIVLIACTSIAELLYAKRLTRKLFETIGTAEDVHIRFTTVDKMRQEGVTGKIWEEA